MQKIYPTKFLSFIFGVFVLGLFCLPAKAVVTTIDIQNNSFVFRDFLGDNPFTSIDDRLVWSVKVDVNGIGDLRPPFLAGDIPIVTTDSPITEPEQMNPLFVPVIPNQFAKALPFNNVLAAQPWTYRAENGAIFDERTVPALPASVIANPISLATSARINGAGEVNWTPSSDPNVNGLTIDILVGSLGNIVAQSTGDLQNPATNTFNLSDLADPAKFFNPTNFQPTVNDQFIIRLRYEIRDNTRTSIEDGQPIGSQISRSSTFISVNVPPPGTPDVFLPTIDVDGVFIFDVEVAANEVFLFDPEIAIGYDYRVDTGPNFASILIPDPLPGGDSMFDLLVNGSIQPLFAGTEFNLLDLNPDGFSSFGIRGIDVGEAIDPNDPLAFVTGLSFVDSGNVSMRMIPVTANVPEPTTIGLVGLGLAGFVFARRRRKLNA